ncbi:unnamed protein product [Closterium sp. Naga37s-1]|nr:unnamed protein product [Closterium sp. Naga37s-1]
MPVRRPFPFLVASPHISRALHHTHLPRLPSFSPFSPFSPLQKNHLLRFPRSPAHPATTLSGLHLSFAALAGLLCLCLARFLPPPSPSPSPSFPSPAPLSPSASLLPPSTTPPPAPVPTLPAWEVGRFTLLSNVCVVTTNFALLANSVGFYQISRLAIIPLTCAFESLLHGKTYSPPTLGAVLVVLVGVGVCTVTDVSVSAFGLATAAAGAVSTSLQQISVGDLQQRYALGSFDLLIQTAPLQAVSLLLLGPTVDYLLTGYSVIHYTLTADATAWILLSCILALLTTVSVYLCIGKFSAVSFQVLGMVLYSWAVEKERRAREGAEKDEEEGCGATADGAAAAAAEDESVAALRLNETTPLLQAQQGDGYGSGVNSVTVNSGGSSATSVG